MGSSPTALLSSSSSSTSKEGAAVASNNNTTKKNLRGLFSGSGVEGMSNPLVIEQILDLLPPEKKHPDKMKDVTVLYLGTATYDIAVFRDKQTRRFVDRGCTVRSLDVALGDNNDATASERIIGASDIIVVSGGNTLYAIDRWNHLGLIPHLRAAMDRGCILTGGSAGAICWFDSGHSDSADPDTYLIPMLEEHGSSTCSSSNSSSSSHTHSADEPDTNTVVDESSSYDASNKKEWKYVRVPGLGFVPGSMVCCPHHDRVQSNGLLRAHDFDKMLLARARAARSASNAASVLGIGIDHYASFVVEGDAYKVYSLPGKPGSVSKDDNTNADAEGRGAFAVGEDGTATGTPGVWIKRVVTNNNSDDLVVEAMVCPPEGNLADLLAYGGDNLCGNTEDNDDDEENQNAVDKCRRENPSGLPL